MFSAIAALLHIGCIYFGAPWYRFFGAGEEMAQMAERGEMRPHLITAFIVLVLTTWSLYALSGAGALITLPLLRFGLCVITGIYLLRGLAGFLLIRKPMGRSPAFWAISSAICLAGGLLHLVGLLQVWDAL